MRPKMPGEYRSCESQIPIVDGRNLLNLSQKEFDFNDPTIQGLAGEIRDALHNHGFMYLSNHGISQELVAKTFEECRLFFTLPDDVKQKYTKTPGKDGLTFHGYTVSGRDMKHVEDGTIREWKEYFDFIPGGLTPDKEVPGFAPTIKVIQEACCQLQLKLLRLLAFSLGLEDKDFFYNHCKNMVDPLKYTGRSGLRTAFYAPIPENLKTLNPWIGRHEHTDWGVFTLLFQDNVGGLEVKNAQGEWVKATPVPNSIVCNTGGLFDLWTRGYFPATPHRVLINNSDGKNKGHCDVARQSFGYFLCPDDATLVEPLKTEVLPQKSDGKYNAVLAGEYFLKRAHSTLADIVYKFE